MDVDTEVSSWRRSEFFRRMRAHPDQTHGLACAQAATLCTEVVGHLQRRLGCLGLSARSQPLCSCSSLGHAPVLEHHPLGFLVSVDLPLLLEREALKLRSFRIYTSRL